MRSAVSNRVGARRGSKAARARRARAAGERAATAILCAVAALCLVGVGVKGIRRAAEGRALTALRGRLDSAAEVVWILPADTPAPAGVAPAIPTPTPDPAAEQARLRLENLRALQAENAELFGWVALPGTGIDYPVMFSPDRPWHYLDHDFAGGSSKSGLPFIDESCHPHDSRANLLLHGHNMKDGSMFSPLHKLADKEYYDAHRTLTFDTPDAAETYRVFAVAYAEIVEESDFKYYLYTDVGAEDEFNEYLRLLRAHSIHAWDTDAAWGDSLLTLSTCSKHDTHGRLVVAAKRVA